MQIRFGAGELVSEGAALLVPDTVVPLCAPEHAAALRSWDGIRSAALIRTLGTSDHWGAWAERLGLPAPPAATQSVDSYLLAMELARTGGGVALASRLLAQRYIAAGELAIPLDLSAPAIDNHYIAIRAPADEKTPARQFERWLREQTRADAQ